MKKFLLILLSYIMAALLVAVGIGAAYFVFTLLTFKMGFGIVLFALLSVLALMQYATLPKRLKDWEKK
jgi:hypothetical protein